MVGDASRQKQIQLSSGGAYVAPKKKYLHIDESVRRGNLQRRFVRMRIYFFWPTRVMMTIDSFFFLV